MPMQNGFLFAEMKALGVCPCHIYYLWQSREHWVCAHAEFVAFGRNEGTGRVPTRIVSAGTQGKGAGGRGGDESDAMDAASTAVWRRPAQPARGGCMRCVRGNRPEALRDQTPTPPSLVPPMKIFFVEGRGASVGSVCAVHTLPPCAGYTRVQQVQCGALCRWATR